MSYYFQSILKSISQSKYLVSPNFCVFFFRNAVCNIWAEIPKTYPKSVNPKT